MDNNTTAITTTMSAGLGTAQVADLVLWALDGFPKEGNQTAAFAIAAALIIAAHGVQKGVSALLAKKATPEVTPTP